MRDSFFFEQLQRFYIIYIAQNAKFTRRILLPNQRVYDHSYLKKTLFMTFYNPYQLSKFFKLKKIFIEKYLIIYILKLFFSCQNFLNIHC